MARNRGFVLPTTLMVMTLLTVMLTAAFTMVSAEYRTTDNALARARAHSLAQAGLQNYYSLNRPLSSSYDSVRITLTSGYADVVARRLRDSTATDAAVWLIRSTAAASDPLQPGSVAATRSVVQLAEHQDGFPARAALFAANGVHYVTVSGTGMTTTDGTDGCGVTGSVPGVVYPTGRLTPWWSPGAYSSRVDAGSGAGVIAASRIDWVALTNGDVTPDYTVPGSTPSWNTNSIILVNGNLTLTSAEANPGTGILIVTGNLTLTGDPQWRGAILVGGRLVTSLSTRYEVYGIVVTGLNIALGQAVPADTLVRGDNNRELQWHSCRYLPAVASMSALMPIGNAWADTWSTY